MNKIIGVLLVLLVMGNMFFCFYIGSEFLLGGKWFVVPGVISLFIWFFGVALIAGGIGDKSLNKG